MSRMRSTRKPPLAKSPIRVGTRRVLRSNSDSLQTPPGFLTKSQKPSRGLDVQESELRPEFRSISCELRALAKMVRDEFGKGDGDNGGDAGSINAKSSCVFERGRLYEEYSARRNERLKRKKGERGDEEKSPYNLGVSVEPKKRRDAKKVERLRKSISATYSVEQPRYMLRSMSKENKKPPLAERSVMVSERKMGSGRVSKI